MSFTLKYVGKKTTCVGKTLWEILGNLKDFGVGRIIVRNTYANKYKEPCYMKILEVTARPNWEEPKLKKYRPPNDLRDKVVSVSLVFHFIPFHFTSKHFLSTSLYISNSVHAELI